jgi:dTMP kinase
MPSGKFIAFCGGEGAGKSTQIAALARYLESRGIPALTTREPGGTPEGQHLRKLLLTETAGSWTPLAETLLMVADRAQHIERVIAPALAAGTHVISDRFVLSTLSYQGAGRGVPAALIRDLHRQSCGDLWPDLTVIFDIDPAIGLARSKRRLSRSGSDEGPLRGARPRIPPACPRRLSCRGQGERPTLCRHRRNPADRRDRCRDPDQGRGDAEPLARFSYCAAATERV